MSVQYVQVNVGRNVGDIPLGAGLWDAFIWDVVNDIINSSRDGVPYPFQRHVGTGAWIDEDGRRIEEDSVHISVMIDIDAYALRLALAATAKKYGQDAIALIIGSELIEGN